MPAPKNRVHLTDRLLRTLRAEGQRRQLMDTAVPNFGVRVSPSGRIVFFVRYRIGRQSRRYNLDTYPNLALGDARNEARGVLHRAYQGQDPQRERLHVRRAATFGDLAAEYIDRHARPNLRSWETEVRVLEKDLLPAWRNLPAHLITAADVRLLLDGIVDRGAPVMANRTRGEISRIFNFAIGRQILDHNPASRVRPPAREQSRQIVLTEQQIKTLWALWNREASPVAGAFQFLLVTAQRGMEVLTMRWQDVEGSWWRIPPEVVKNKLAHRVHLSPLAHSIIERQRASAGTTPWVFASPRLAGRHLFCLHEAAKRYRSTSGLSGWTAHDLRRTAATFMSRLGVPRLVIAKILNHADTGVTAIYDRADYELEIRDGLSRWGSKLQELLDIDLAPSEQLPSTAAPAPTTPQAPSPDRPRQAPPTIPSLVSSPPPRQYSNRRL